MLSVFLFEVVCLGLFLLAIALALTLWVLRRCPKGVPGADIAPLPPFRRTMSISNGRGFLPSWARAEMFG